MVTKAHSSVDSRASRILRKSATIRPDHFNAVTLELRKMVLSGEFVGSSKLRQVHLAERFGISRTPIRLALGVLARERLLDHEPRRGFVVREITQERRH